MQASTDISMVSAALVKAQGEFPPVSMNCTNPYYNSRYADLGAVIEVAIPVLQKHGLAFSQAVEGGDGQVGITTILLHESGQYISSYVVIPIEGKNMAQEAGKAITYLRRYALSSMLGLFTEEDNDGNPGMVETAESLGGVSKGRPVAARAGEAKMTLDEANAVVGDKGECYGDLSLAELSVRFNALSKKKSTDEFTDKDARKLAAAELLIAAKRKA